MPRFAVAFSLSSVGQYLGFAGSNPFVGSMDLFQKNLFLAFRGFGSSRRRDGSVLEGTICKQFVSNVKTGRIWNPVVGSSPSGRLRSVFSSWKIAFLVVRILRLEENRKWIYGNSKKVRREKSGEISRNLRFSALRRAAGHFSRSDLNRPKDLAGAVNFEPYA